MVLCRKQHVVMISGSSVFSPGEQHVSNRLRKWDRLHYSVTLVSRDVWMNSNEEKGDSLRVAK